MNKWKNCGDRKFLDYGGCLVRHHFTEEEVKANPELSSMFDVFELAPISEEEVFAGLSMIDLDDLQSWMDSKTIMKFFNFDKEADFEMLKKEDPEELAAAIVQYYGSHMCLGSSYRYMYPSPEDFFITKEEASDWMTELGAAEYT